MPEPVPATGVASRRWWDLSPKERNIVAFTLLFLITLPMLTKIFTSDFGTHIALGRHVVNNHEIPSIERWNYPSLGMENGSGGEWGFQAVLYLVYAATGEYGVSFLVWAVVLGIFLFLYRAIVLRGAHPIVAVLAIFAFSGFLRIRIQPRPEIFTYLFTAMTIYLLSEYYFGSRKKLIYLFPPMILVWANSHPTYLMAFALCGAFFADALVRAAWRKEFQWPLLRAWIVPPLATGLAGLVLCGLNPHGYGWLLAPLHMISRGAGTGAGNILLSISELTPVKGTGFFVYYKAAAVFAAVSLCLGVAGRRVYLLDLFLFAIAFKGAWDSARAVSMMGLFLSPGASLHLTGFLSAAAGWFSANATRKGDPSKRPARQKGKKGPHPAVPPRFGESRPSVAVGYAAVVGVVILALVSFGGTTLAFSFSQLEYGVGITEHKFSFKAAEFLRRNPVQGKMFNFFDIGGFLDWQLYPGAMTFLDGRTYNQQVFMEHQAVTGGGPGWERVIDKYGITYFVLKTMDSSGMILPIVPILANDPNWALVFSDGLFVVFVRKTPELAGYVQAHEMPKGILPRHIIEEAFHYTYLGISPVVAYQTVANMYLIMGDRPRAIQSLRSALEEVDDPYLRSRLMQLEQGQSGPAR
ncbi:MAG TPA: hypothetical protein DDX05_02080 [Deltaproteobacteria bacterium]|nr:MAG: hypothetical protein A2X90_07580 [Deltaproteobacteria bacterium GWA2_65_63]OGP26666.1 MAG: hypothetical protein A2X91_01840 [Deltaproteobacteria bacterium GWB2_65_81]OGP39189.1 MAG: hypothetical protein A2X98_02215 [Deltaproteobacteria bacterium GWC2_66_88]OGP80134.1 MAG: hypothetical protein A2Z26_04135 [Deltaproteobacteria bacterium RBG_16_66_15]HBG72424.1 hypothetical protein [Deltaproteobacteria bacterium]